ncbi:Uncharacterised protein [Vibrio cholerae]|nr:Uncharacterised protein [Vibrio cholerae]CSD04785.1 Uncharacterised protein [Vibrio cholerae]
MLHPLFNLFSGLIEAVQLTRHTPRSVNVVTQQKFNAERHIIQTPCGVNPWSKRKAKISSDQTARIPFGDFNQSLNTGAR